MPKTFFLSFRADDFPLARHVAGEAERRGLSCIHYDPSLPWEEPIDRIALIIRDKVDFVVCLRGGRPLSRAVAAEVEWARECGRPTLFVDDVDAIGAILDNAHAVRGESDSMISATDQFRSLHEAFSFWKSAYDRSDFAQEANWKAKCENEDNLLLMLAATVPVCVACGVLSLSAFVLSLLWSKWFLLLAVPSLVISSLAFWLARSSLRSLRAIHAAWRLRRRRDA